MLSFLGAFQRGIKEGRRQMREELQLEIAELREEVEALTEQIKELENGIEFARS